MTKDSGVEVVIKNERGRMNYFCKVSFITLTALVVLSFNTSPSVAVETAVHKTSFDPRDPVQVSEKIIEKMVARHKLEWMRALKEGYDYPNQPQPNHDKLMKSYGGDGTFRKEIAVLYTEIVPADQRRKVTHEDYLTACELAYQGCVGFVQGISTGYAYLYDKEGFDPKFTYSRLLYRFQVRAAKDKNSESNFNKVLIRFDDFWVQGQNHNPSTELWGKDCKDHKDCSQLAIMTGAGMAEFIVKQANFQKMMTNPAEQKRRDP